MVCFGAARRVSRGRYDECALRGHAHNPIQHREWSSSRRDLRRTGAEIDDQLATLDRPRKYYQNYYRTRGANDNMMQRAAGAQSILPRVLSLQERGLAG